MITKEFFDKIRWDGREKPEDYEVLYFDRIEKKLIPLPYTKILRIEGNSMVIERNGEEIDIPLHRVRQVKRKGVIVWQSRLHDYNEQGA